MLRYAVCEISGKQYKIVPGSSVGVDWLGDETKKLEVKTLLVAEDDGVKIGTPYLKEELPLEVVGEKKTKIRVAKFHAKANYRRVTGIKRKTTLVSLVVKKGS